MRENFLHLTALHLDDLGWGDEWSTGKKQKIIFPLGMSKDVIKKKRKI